MGNFDTLLHKLDLLRDEVLALRTAHTFHDLNALLHTSEWPVAVPAELICDEDEKSKATRAEDILGMYPDVDGLAVLDFGCGEGHLVQVATKARKAVGYDITQSGSLLWEQPEGYLLTTDFDKVVKNGPYDMVIVYDVLDHIQTYATTPLNRIASVCKPETTVHVRSHPYTSRHGAHLYKQLNKAWIQLVFRPEELFAFGLKPEYVWNLPYPVNTYRSWFDQAGFEIVSEQIQHCEVESFFKNVQIVRERLMRNYENGYFPEHQMSQEFVDFVLKVKKK